MSEEIDSAGRTGSGTSRVEIARALGRSGELALLRRGTVLELVVDGVFAMDSAHPQTEQALATLALQRLAAGHGAEPGGGLRVVVAGLGLGFTAVRALADPAVARLDVVELDEVLVEWVRQGLVPSAAGLLDDPRVNVHVGDIQQVLPRFGPASVDAVLLDIDNGPDFLVHPGNAAVYRAEFLAQAAAALRPGGVLAIWSADPSPVVQAALTEVCGPCTEVLLDASRDGRRFEYAIYLATRRDTGTHGLPG